MLWPVFVKPPGELVVRPHPKLGTDERPAKYKAKKYKDYQHCKINKLTRSSCRQFVHSCLLFAIYYWIGLKIKGVQIC
ncbi:hypothetical protein PR202_gb09949 [Eleusine coracana subsp. coracana]|uniref:Uncharacterized protein n=1 Tax=Eleusine coracana subsp. coracana TaxID=191504 RepID=A0AAV5EGA2_ELECO|nr:hypothetical protein PR202_gb09949 [Eleusine coracana subsp. coracana]